MRIRHITDREREILELAAEGLTDKEIASKIGLSAATVRTYWERIRQKAGVRSRSAAIARILIDELRESSKALEQTIVDREMLLASAEDYAVFNIDSNGRIVDWNIGVARVLGFEREEFVGEHYSIIFTPDDVKSGEPQREMEEANAVGRSLERHYHARKDGTFVWVEGTLVALHDEFGKVRGFSKIIRDASERKTLEEEVQRLRARLSKSEQRE